MTLAINDFKDKVAVVTGGANGIGLAMAERFLAEGAQVVIADIDREAMAAAEQQLNAGERLLSVYCDVSSQEENETLAQTVIDHFGKVNVLCLNAALLGEVDGWRASDVKPDAWHKTLDTNLHAHYYGVSARGAHCIHLFFLLIDERPGRSGPLLRRPIRPDGLGRMPVLGSAGQA
jgi:NAD(P)-dependent dehydrogenase (short-subunit alcohol dehydrogenase family)